MFCIRHNYNDRYDRIFNKCIKIVILLLVNNLFSIKITGFIDIFEALSEAIKTARNVQTKTYIKSLITKLFDTINHRLTLCNFFFKSQNPIHYFYSP